MKRTLSLFLLTIGVLGGPAAARSATHDDLISLYQRFRKDVAVPVRADVADYSPTALAQRHRAASTAVDQIKALDDSAWPIPHRVDLMLALAEARGVDFQHRTLRPWARDPSYWATLDLGWGPKVETAIELPKLPFKGQAERTRLRQQLLAVPRTLALARANLTDMRGDLVRLGITQHAIETRVYGRLLRDLQRTDPALIAPAQSAEAASRAFGEWLGKQLPSLPQRAGVGRTEMDWYLRYVLLFPYTSDEMRTLGEREWERSMVFLKIEENEHRQLPMIEPITSLAAFEALRREADTELLDFLRKDEIMTVPDWLTIPDPEGPYVMPANQDPAIPGPFSAPIARNFFREAEDRDPRSLRAHNLPGHIFDVASRRRDIRPIRQDARLGFIDSSRIEGWAFYLEEALVQAGWLDSRPKAREIHYVLQANRAARLLPELKLHANEWDFDEALASLTGRTPKWMELTDDTASYDMALYLRQPGLGLNYYFGKLQIEQLLAERALQQGDSFKVKQFHDQFIASGLIPIALIRWEMTGKDDQVRLMR